MKENNKMIFGVPSNMFASVAAIITHDLIQQHICVKDFEKFYEKHIVELHDDTQYILKNPDPHIFTFKDKDQISAVKLTAVLLHCIKEDNKNSAYVLSFLNEILYLKDMITIVHGTMAMVKCFVKFRLSDTDTSVEICNKSLAVISKYVTSASIMMPFIYGEKYSEALFDGFKDVSGAYKLVALNVLNTISGKNYLNQSMSAEDAAIILKKAKIAGKKKTLADYSESWHTNFDANGWKGFEKGGRHGYILSPMLLFSMIANANGCGIPYEVRNGLITKADILRLLGFMDHCTFSAGGKSALKVNISDAERSFSLNVMERDFDLSDVDDYDIDINFCYALLFDKLTKELATLKKNALSLEMAKQAENIQHKDSSLSINANNLSALKQQNAKLQSEKKTLEEENKELFAKYTALQNKVSALQNKVNSLQDELAQNKTAGSTTSASANTKPAWTDPNNGMTRRDGPDSTGTELPNSEDLTSYDGKAPELVSNITASMTEEEISTSLCKYESEKRIIIVGGNPNLIKKFRVKHSNMSYMDEKNIGTCDQMIQNADIILFKTDSMSHMVYSKCKQIANMRNIPVDYIPNVAAVPKMEDAVLEILTKNFCEED